MKCGSAFRFLSAFAVCGAIVFGGGVGCSQKAAGPTRALRYAAQKPMVAQIETRTREHRSLSRLTTDASSEASVTEVKLLKSEILGGREFLFGSDLQYSSSFDPGYGLFNQTLALGHEIATFEVRGRKLQLIANQDYLYESNINHPKRLIQEFEILSQDAESLTIVIEKASPAVLTAVEGSQAAAPRQTWVRSVEWVPQGNYLLVQSSVEAANGFIYEFMESVFPRDTLVPVEGYTPLYNDASIEPLADRFRFLSNGAAFVEDLDGVRSQTQLASRFIFRVGEPIRWYVTRNVPAEYLPVIGAAVEGWNRYSRELWDADIVHFEGLLPEGVSVGDPRYNVISWDSVSEAGAAYEMQASDPLTGIQSHSLIYLPQAWINIGYDFWTRGQYSEGAQAAAERLAKQLPTKEFLGRKLPVRCLAHALESLPMRPRSDVSPEQFAAELLKGVVFHEMGHALGMAHNFKGSLSYVPSRLSAGMPQLPIQFSTSIMDYNQFQIERAAFHSVESSEGPLLEYDRQMISALYNDGLELKDPANAPVLPACEDSEADREKDGVDPLCMRYDAGQNPVTQMLLFEKLLADREARLDEIQSLPASIAALAEGIPSGRSDLTIEELKDLSRELAFALQGTLRYYLIAGAQSLARGVAANVKVLRMTPEDLKGLTQLDLRDRGIATPYDLTVMRRETFGQIERLLNLSALPLVTIQSADHLIENFGTWLKAQAVIRQMPAQQGAKWVETLLAPLRGVRRSMDRVESGPSLVRSLRQRLLASLVFSSDVPFYMLPSTPLVSGVDYEAGVIRLLSEVARAPLATETFAQGLAEAAAAASSLVTFAGTELGAQALEGLRDSYQTVLRQSASPRGLTLSEREAIRAILKTLNGV